MSDTVNQAQIKLIGEEILKRVESTSKVSLFSKDFWYGSIMDWSMKNEKFKTNMFRFVDVLPALNSGQEIARHLKEYFADKNEELPPVFNVGMGLGSLAPGLMAGAIRKNVTQMATMFITGENPEKALPVLRKSRKNKITFTVDILGEATLSEKEAGEYQSRYLELIDWLTKDSQTWEEIPQIDRDHEGPIPKVNVSVKLTALYSQINDKAWDHSKNILKERLRPIFRAAMNKQVFLNLDMEHYGVKHLTLEVFKELLIESEFQSYKFFGCVVQAYLRDSLEDLRDLREFSQKRGTPFTIRLVKGAYWDSETIEAEQRGWAIPVYTNKQESDANYEQCAQYLLENYKFLRVALASHNVRTLAAAIACAQRLNLPPAAFEIQMLYGMADPIKKALVEMGFRVREYAPIGELIPGMAYLVRRLLENTSNESWLRGKFAEGKSSNDLLKDPTYNLSPSSNWPVKKDKFYNEPLLDWAIGENRNKQLAAIKRAEDLVKNNSINITPILIGKEESSEELFTRVNPSKTNQNLYQAKMASIQQAETAMQTANQYFQVWKKVPALQRADILDKLAELMVRDRFELSATQVMEVGKPWAEADADVAEAIDFCRYYARHMRKLSEPISLAGIPGESNLYTYRPRGVCVVIAPWNFPLAILTGQVVSALVTGNTVVMKPAEQSMWVAHGLMKLLLEAGFPKESVSFLPGYGEKVGAYLVRHAQTAIIAFTGSRTVGLNILRAANEIAIGQKHVKKCIIEMGGKNALIIDNDADLDEAVDGVLYSAFGFAGQKCSAASRCIVLEEVYEKFVHRLVEAADSLDVLPAENPRAYMGPVVDQEAQQRILQTIRDAEANHRLLFKSKVPENGYFVPITIFDQVEANDKLAQDEIFGPVLAIIKAKDIQEAVKIANSTEYALTGGMFSRSPANISYVRENLECGNLYVNRGITGAMVDRHPFGGFKMSGIGSKTGGPDYLQQFMEPITLTENTMRRGFAATE